MSSEDFNNQIAKELAWTTETLGKKEKSTNIQENEESAETVEAGVKYPGFAEKATQLEDQVLNSAEIDEEVKEGIIEYLREAIESGTHTADFYLPDENGKVRPVRTRITLTPTEVGDLVNGITTYIETMESTKVKDRIREILAVIKKKRGIALADFWTEDLEDVLSGTADLSRYEILEELTEE